MVMAKFPLKTSVSSTGLSLERVKKVTMMFIGNHLSYSPSQTMNTKAARRSNPPPIKTLKLRNIYQKTDTYHMMHIFDPFFSYT